MEWNGNGNGADCEARGISASEQGERVRAVKEALQSGGASEEQMQAELAGLLELKAKLAAGHELAGGGSKKKKKKKKSQPAA